MAISKANATKLAAWLALHEPNLFRQILVRTQKLQRSPLGRMGYFGDDTAVSSDSTDLSFTPTATYMTDATASLPDVSAATDTTAALSDIPISSDVTSSISAAPTVDSSVADSSSSAGSFWSSLGSGVSSVAGAVGKVASALVSPQSIQAAGNVASAYFKAQAQNAQTQQQAALVNAQLSRVGAGYSPAPVTYQRNPVTGQLVPVYASNSGAVPVTGSLYNRLLSPSGGTLPSWVLPAGIGAAILVILLLAAPGRG